MIDFFFSPDRPVSLYLNLLILAVTAVALVEVFRELVGRVYPTGTDLEALKKQGSQDDAEALLALAGKVTKEGVVQRRLQLLRGFQRRREPVDEEVLAAISAEAFRDAAPVARLATSILVLLGLAGTLVGLSLAVSGLSTLLSGSMGARDLAGAILATLGQMKVAFSTTLAGVLGSVMVGAALALLRHRQSAVIRTLEELSATEWTPLFQTTEKTRLTDAVKELEATRKVLTEGLDATLKKVSEGFASLGNQFREQGADLLREVAALRDSTLAIIGDRGEESLTLAEYVDTVKLTTDQLQESVRASGELLPNVQRALEETIRTEQHALSTTLSEHTRAVQPVLERQEAAAAALSQAVSAELSRLSDVKDVLDRLNTSFEGARGTWERADESIERMGRETATALRDGLREAMRAVAHLTEEQARSQQRVTAVLDGFQETYQETMRMLADQSRRALNQSQEMVGEIRATLRESLELVGQRLIESQRGTGDRVATSLNALGRELRDLSDGRRPVDKAPVRASQAGAGNTSSATDGMAGHGAHRSPRADPSSPTASPTLAVPPEEIREDLEGVE